jgi:hypothetical protein
MSFAIGETQTSEGLHWFAMGGISGGEGLRHHAGGVFLMAWFFWRFAKLW